MAAQIPDGEYDLDFSALFSSTQSEIFGIRYGFKPDTIDQSSSSRFYIDDSEQPDTDTKEVPCYLVFESKVNEKAITSDHNKDEHIYFEGRSGPNVSSSISSATSTNESTSRSDYFLCYDDVSKSFKIDTFNGFIKMNKSRESERISKSISKISKSSKAKPAYNSTSLMPSYLDSLLSNFSNSNLLNGDQSTTTIGNNTTTTTFNTIPNATAATATTTTTAITTTTNTSLISSTGSYNVVNNLNIPIEHTKSTTPYGKLLTSISPIRKPGSPAHSPSIKSKLAGKSLSPSPSLTRPLSPLVSTSPLNASTTPSSSRGLSQSLQSPSPVLKTSRSGSSNGGTGLRKPQKSLLLRKAERAVGINKGNRYKSRVSSAASPSLGSSVQRRTNDKLTSNIKKDLDNDSKEFRLRQTERERERPIKEARPEQAAFELNLTFPPASKPSSKSIPESVTKQAARPITQPISVSKAVLPSVSKSMSIPDSGSVNVSNITSKVNPIRKSDESTNMKPIRKSPSPLISDDELEKFTSFDENAIMSEDEGDKTINFNNASKKIEKSNTENDDIDDDFNLDFSDWEDADALSGPIIFEDTETAGNSDFNLIIEDDPIKTKRENEKEMEKRRQQEREDTLQFKEELARKERELKMQQEKKQNATKKKTKQLKPPKTASKTVPTMPGHKIDDDRAEVKPSTITEIEQDKAFDEAFDEAFDDISDEEDISEEE